MSNFIFEYDEEKNLENKKKHGIDFKEAQNLWNDIFRLVIPAKTIDEERYLLVAEYNHHLWSAIYTIRNENIRIISVRKARINEKKLYQSWHIR